MGPVPIRVVSTWSGSRGPLARLARPCSNVACFCCTAVVLSMRVRRYRRPTIDRPSATRVGAGQGQESEEGG